MADVFISYVEEDGPAAAELAAGTEAAGYSVWYYERDSIPGPSYFAQVNEAIEGARAVVLFISPDSLGSNQVYNEIVIAHESRKAFIPVLIGISHAEFQQRQPGWRVALGASTSIRVPPQGVAAIVPRVVQGLKALGLKPGGAAPPPERESQPPVASGEIITNSIGIRLRLIPAGRFLMGSNKGGNDEKPVHEVTIAKPFYIGVHPVTQAEYERVMKANPSHFKGPNRPVETVSWNDAVEFCRALSEIEHRAYRLPTEAEWEYACRAGSTAEYCFGDDEAMLGEYAWFDGNSGGQTHDVGQKKPNAWGLNDMHGNVWEWCSDWHHLYEATTQSDPVGPASGGYRVLRGGSWNDNPWFLRSAHRPRNTPDRRYYSFGFRLLCLAAGPD
ncbi:MAG TPA: SUMF1/EgtB/PvdO family nonheme iron enzyme [Planctomycetota bacterium]|nr:SUMF1/EgtB/PvdO family nonheme iron enzyme [Planctomycetota bacterium]